MGDNNSDQYDLEMVNVEVPAYSSDDEDEFDTTDSEYGEDSLHERAITPNNTMNTKSLSKSDFYKKSMRRQNICFGSSVFALVGMFIAAYFYMDISFSPADVGIFGDEIAMKGASGEVGLDADNAETQAIIDEEIIALEETGHWGENAKEKRSKIEDIIFDKDKIGEHKWVEDSDWWKNNIGNMDVSYIVCNMRAVKFQQLDFDTRTHVVFFDVTISYPADIKHDKEGTQNIRKDEEEGNKPKEE